MGKGLFADPGDPLVVDPVDGGQVEPGGAVTLGPDIPAEPKDSDLDAALQAARECKPNLVVGLGGGSVMDVAKLVAVVWSEQRLADVVGPDKVL